MNVSELPLEILGEIMNVFTDDDLTTAMSLTRASHFFYSLRTSWLTHVNINVVNGPITNDMLHPSAPRLHGLAITDAETWHLYHRGICVESLGLGEQYQYCRFYSDIGFQFTEHSCLKKILVGRLKPYCLNTPRAIRVSLNEYEINADGTIREPNPWLEGAPHAYIFAEARIGDRALLLEECVRRMITTAK
jgi:hypothetical protein